MSDEPPRRPWPPLLPANLRRVPPLPPEASENLGEDSPLLLALAARKEAGDMLDKALEAYRSAITLRRQAGFLFLASLVSAIFNLWISWHFWMRHG